MHIQRTLISFTFLFCGLSTADDLFVPADYPSIQAAIDAADNGDVVRVSPGNYFENIDFLGKPITVVSTDGASVTGIKAPAESELPTVRFASKESSTSVLSGFKIGGGYGAPFQDSVFGPCIVGAGIYCFESRPRIEFCQFLSNRVDGPLSGSDGHGGGLAIIRGDVELKGCEFIGNTSVGHGGAMYIVGPCAPSIDGCLFDGNEGSWGGAVTCTEQVTGTFLNCTFRDNTAFNVGGAVYVRSQSSPSFIGVMFRANIQAGNSVAGGAAVTVYGAGTGGGPCYPTFRDCQFEMNIAEGYGGAVSAAYSGNPTFTDCVFVSNEAGRSGGAVSAVGDPAALTNVTLDNCSIQQNDAAETGGGIDVREATLILQNSMCSLNTAALQGGGCDFEASSSISPSSMSNSKICENIPNQTNGVFSDDGGNIIEDVCLMCPADLSGDGFVNSEDLGLILVQWGTNGSGDLDGNNQIDASDLGLLLVQWGPCS